MTAIYITRGTHYDVPNERSSAHWTQEDAVSAAFDMLDIIRNDLADLFGQPLPALERDKALLMELRALQAQRVIWKEGGSPDDHEWMLNIEHSFDQDDLDGESGFSVWIEQLALPTPRVLVTVEDGIVHDVVTSAEIAVTFIDYDTEDCDEPLWLIPRISAAGTLLKGLKSAAVSEWDGVSVVDPAEISLKLDGKVLYRDPDATPEEAFACWCEAYDAEPDTGDDMARVSASFCFQGEMTSVGFSIDATDMDGEVIMEKMRQAIHWAYGEDEVSKMDIAIIWPEVAS